MNIRSSTQRAIRKPKALLASIGYAAATVGMQKPTASYLASTTHVPCSPVIQAALVPPTSLGVALVIATGSQDVSPADVADTPGMNLREESEDKPSAYMETQSLYVDLENPTTNNALQSSVLGDKQDTVSQISVGDLHSG